MTKPDADVLPFCVLLHVEGDKFARTRGGASRAHWDWLFATDKDGPLITWSGDVLVEGGTLDLGDLHGTSCSVVRLPDHRRKYLTYDGPLSGDRGSVCGILRGAYRLGDQRANRFEAVVVESTHGTPAIIRFQWNEPGGHRPASATAPREFEGSNWTLTVESSKPNVSEPASEAI
ncbi:MAG: hypothetical protein AAF802_14965 [Planctomycetota bacterium]